MQLLLCISCWDEKFALPLLRDAMPVSWMALVQRQAPNRLLNPSLCSETVAICPGDKNHLPARVVVERLHIRRPEPRQPLAEPERKAFEEVLWVTPVSHSS